MSLQSGLPNEIDFAINALLLLTSGKIQQKSNISLCKNPGLINSLISITNFTLSSDLRHTPFDLPKIKYTSCPSNSSSKMSYPEPVQSLNFSLFWLCLLKDTMMENIILVENKNQEFELLSEWWLSNRKNRSIHRFHQKCIRNTTLFFKNEIFRLEQILVIIMNICLDRRMSLILTSDNNCTPSVLFLLLMSIHLKCNRILVKTAWNALASICYFFILPPITNPISHILISVLTKCIQLPDLSLVTSVLECTTALASQPQNTEIIQTFLLSHPEFMFALGSRHVLSPNLMLKINALECLYYLSCSCEETCNVLASHPKLIEILLHNSTNLTSNTTVSHQKNQLSPFQSGINNEKALPSSLNSIEKEERNIESNCASNSNLICGDSIAVSMNEEKFSSLVSVMIWLKKKYHLCSLDNSDDEIDKIISLRDLLQDLSASFDNSKNCMDQLTRAVIHLFRLLLPDDIRSRNKIWNLMLELTANDAIENFWLTVETINPNSVLLPFTRKKTENSSIKESASSNDFINASNVNYEISHQNDKFFAVVEDQNLLKCDKLRSLNNSLLHINKWWFSEFLQTVGSAETQRRNNQNSEHLTPFSDEECSFLMDFLYSPMKIQPGETLDPLTESARLTSALILRNMANKSEHARHKMQCVIEERLLDYFMKLQSPQSIMTLPSGVKKSSSKSLAPLTEETQVLYDVFLGLVE